MMTADEPVSHVIISSIWPCATHNWLWPHQMDPFTSSRPRTTGIIKAEKNALFRSPTADENPSEYFLFFFHWIQFLSEIKVIYRHEHPARPRSHHSDHISLAIMISPI